MKFGIDGLLISNFLIEKNHKGAFRERFLEILLITRELYLKIFIVFLVFVEFSIMFGVSLRREGPFDKIRPFLLLNGF